MAKKTVTAQNEGANTLTMGGKTYTFAWDFNAISDVQLTTGINLLAEEDDFAPLRLRARVWAALLPHHPDLTLEGAGKLLTPKTMGGLIKAVSRTWTDPEAQPNEGNATD